MLPHPQASPASSSTTTGNDKSRTPQSITSTPPSVSSSSSTDSTSTWTQRDNIEYLDSPTPSPRVLRSQSNRHDRDLSLTLDLNLVNDDNNNDDDIGFNEFITSTRGDEGSDRVASSSIELLSSGLEQLEVDTESNNRVRGTRGNQDTIISSGWLKSRRATLDNLVDPELLEEHWYSMTNTPYRESEDSNQVSPAIADGDQGIVFDDEACFVDCYDGVVGMSFKNSSPEKHMC